MDQKYEPPNNNAANPIDKPVDKYYIAPGLPSASVSYELPLNRNFWAPSFIIVLGFSLVAPDVVHGFREQSAVLPIHSGLA